MEINHHNLCLFFFLLCLKTFFMQQMRSDCHDYTKIWFRWRITLYNNYYVKIKKLTIFINLDINIRGKNMLLIRSPTWTGYNYIVIFCLLSIIQSIKFQSHRLNIIHNGICNINIILISYIIPTWNST